jgi:hypothetical protein
MFSGFKSSVPALDPKELALSIVDAVRRELPMLILPTSLLPTLALGGMMSTECADLLGRVSGLHDVMNNFTGRGVDFAMKKIN